MGDFSEFDYKGKTIIYIDYSGMGDSKEKILQLIQVIQDKYRENAPNSVLALVNIANMHFDMDILSAFKESRRKFALYEKKAAIIGAKGLLLAAYNCVIGVANPTVKNFDSEPEAQEWLVND